MPDQPDYSTDMTKHRLRAVLNAAVDAIITIDRRGIITHVNPATERMFGYTADEMLGNNVKMLMPSPYREQHDQYLDRYHQTREARIIGIGREVQAQCKDGTIFPVDLVVSEIDHMECYTGIIRDISDRKQMERHMATCREHERRLIARELHDNLGGHLTGISMLAKAMSIELERANRPEMPTARQLVEEIGKAHDTLRRLSHGLMPVDIEAGGLAAALEILAHRYNCSDDVRCCFKGSATVRLQDPIAVTQLYRIAEEAVANAARHAQAEHITIGLDEVDDHVQLIIRDDGIGFRGIADSRKGMGLRTMDHRARMIGAILTVGPDDKKGSVVACMLHLHPR